MTPRALRSIAVLLACAAGVALPAAAQTAACPVPDTRATVVLGGLDTGVPNLDADGAGPSACTLNDLIRDEAEWRGAPAFVAHVESVLAGATGLDAAGRAAILATARRSDIGGTRRVVRLLAYNDLHGNLRSPGGLNNFRYNAATEAPRSIAAQPAGPGTGGVDFLAATIDALRANAAHGFVISTGDAIGASPLVSAFFQDEVTIEAMNLIGTDVNIVGNHEFDEGRAELLRMQQGGCHPTLAAQGRSCILQGGGSAGNPFAGRPFAGARFPFLSANVVDTGTGRTLFPASTVRQFGPVRVGFVGVVLEDTPSIVTPSGVAGLAFRDEAEMVNAHVRQLRNRGIESVILLLHQGGSVAGTNPLNRCEGLGGPLRDIVAQLDVAVDAVFSAHTHQGYVCALPTAGGRTIPVVSGRSAGQIVSAVDLLVDARTKDVVASSAWNTVVDRGNAALQRIVAEGAKYRQLDALVADYEAAAAPLASRTIGFLNAPADASTDASCERAAGNLIADSQLEATLAQGAQIAFMNPGGIRGGGFAGANRQDDGRILYEDAFTVQPFGNSLVTLTLDGAQIRTLLEQQFTGFANAQPFNRVLSPSRGFEYAWSATAPAGSRVDPASIRLNGQPVLPGTRYRVTVNNFLADGGDQFTVLRDAGERVGGAQDIDALTAWLAPTWTAAGAPATGGPGLARQVPPALDRIRRLDAGASCPNAL